VFVKLDAGSEDVSLMGNNLREAAKVAEFGEGVAAAELSEQGNQGPAGVS
jgi:hypothetical protein